ncbi:hypothetical protein D9M70_258810 [compost metagenome]
MKSAGKNPFSHADKPLSLHNFWSGARFDTAVERCDPARQLSGFINVRCRRSKAWVYVSLIPSLRRSWLKQQSIAMKLSAEKTVNLTFGAESFRVDGVMRNYVKIHNFRRGALSLQCVRWAMKCCSPRLRFF